jgi:flavin reductase (DIM6/NTAB) family NADH-FMN oxidoreductase RutF
MWLSEQARKALTQFALGLKDIPNQCVIGLDEPQSEIGVELHGLGSPRDVTTNHVPACAAPFTIGIGFEPGEGGKLQPGTRVSLHVRERGGGQRLLGELRLRHAFTIPVDGLDVSLFTIRNTRNYCLPRLRLWARYGYWAYSRLRKPPDISMRARDIHAMPVLFTCPRPVVLVSVGDGTAVNAFPMNLMGPLIHGHFGFALNSTRAAAAFVQRSGRIALSAIPVEQASLVRSLGGNHKKESVRRDELPFPVALSTNFGLPVPAFSRRVRELEVMSSLNMGSHTLFLARVVHDERWSNGLEFFVVHGIYEAWRKDMQIPHPLPATRRAI